MPPSSHAASHLSTAASHRSTTSSHLSTATSHGSRTDALAAMDRDTPHQSEASRSDVLPTHRDAFRARRNVSHAPSSASSSSTALTDDDDANSLFDNENHYIIAPPIHTADGPRLRVRPLNRTAVVGGMGAQFATTGAHFTAAGPGEGAGEEDEGGGLGVVQQMLEHTVWTAQTAGGPVVRETEIMGTVGEVGRGREEMDRARLVRFPVSVGCELFVRGSGGI